MSKRTEMLNRIADAMPEDAEVQEWVAKELERAGRSAVKTQKRLDMAIEALKRHISEDEAICAKEFAHEVNRLFPGQNWNTRTASYYLRLMVERKLAEVVSGEKSSPKLYFWF